MVVVVVVIVAVAGRRCGDGLVRASGAAEGETAAGSLVFFKAEKVSTRGNGFERSVGDGGRQGTKSGGGGGGSSVGSTSHQYIDPCSDTNKGSTVISPGFWMCQCVVRRFLPKSMMSPLMESGSNGSSGPFGPRHRTFLSM